MRTWSDDDKEMIRDLLPRLEDVLTAKLAQDELRQSLRSLELAQERARIGSWELDPEMQRGTWSAEMFVLYHRDPALVPPTPAEVMQLIHPDDREFRRGRVGRV